MRARQIFDSRPISTLTDAELSTRLTKARNRGMTRIADEAQSELWRRRVAATPARERSVSNTPRQTLSQAYEDGGFIPRNIRWSWSAQAADGRVGVTVWMQDIQRIDGRLVDDWTAEKADAWKSRLLAAGRDPDAMLGLRGYIEDLKLALANGGIVDVIVITRKGSVSLNGDVSKIESAVYRSDLRGRITRFDEIAQTWRIEIEEAR